MSLQCPVSVGIHLEDSPCGGSGGGGSDGTLSGLPIYEENTPGGSVGGTTSIVVPPVITGVTSLTTIAPALEIEGVS